MRPKKIILCVDDNEQDLSVLKFMLSTNGYRVVSANNGADAIDITLENGQQRRNLRMGLLTLNYGHNNEIYGSMVTYLRIKNIVPPASEPRTGQKK